MQAWEMEYSFGDLVNLKQVQALADSFKRLTGLPVSIADGKGVLLVEAVRRRICTDFFRVNPKTHARCVQSDMGPAGLPGAKTGYAFHNCLNGLVKIAIPLLLGDMRAATLFAGPFLLEPPDRDFFRKQAAMFGFDERSHLEALDEVPIMSETELAPAALFLADLASLLGETGLGHKRLADMNRLLEDKVRERTRRLEEEMEERKKAEAEKIRAGRLQGVLEMAGAAAHEFSQPLQALEFDAEFLEERLSGADEDAAETLRSVKDNLKTLSELISKVQNITTYEVKRYSRDRNIIDLGRASQE